MNASSPRDSRELLKLEMPLPLVSVILLSYSRPRELAESLDSIMNQSYPNLDVVVVDNPSALSDQIAEIVGRHPHIRLIRNSENVGFATGMNIGLNAATGEYIHLTEDDIVMDSDCIRELVDSALEDPNLGLVSGIMYNKTSGTIRCAGGRLRPGGMDVFGVGERNGSQYSEPYDVSFIPGAMVFASRELWASLGGFRNDFFMYLEDVELCVRVLRQGRRITIIPAAKVYHFEPPEEPAPDHISFHKMKNHLILNILHAPLGRLTKMLSRELLLSYPASIIRKPKQASLRFRALMHVFARTGTLLRERRALQRKNLKSATQYL